jgi:hypothetical protein
MSDTFSGSIVAHYGGSMVGLLPSAVWTGGGVSVFVFFVSHVVSIAGSDHTDMTPAHLGELLT